MIKSLRQLLRVLILEDSDPDAELVIDDLKQAGFEPTWDRAQDATEFVAALDPDVDVILAISRCLRSARLVLSTS